MLLPMCERHVWVKNRACIAVSLIAADGVGLFDLVKLPVMLQLQAYSTELQKEAADSCARGMVDTAETLKADGNKLFKEGQFKKALKKYKDAITLEPSAALHTNVAACFMKLNRLRDAVENCDNALALDSHWVRAYVRKAELHLQLKEPDEAVSILTKGSDLLPDNDEIRALLVKAREESYERIRTEDVRFLVHERGKKT